MNKITTRSSDTFSIHNMTRIALMTAILCIFSPMALPIGPIPVSLSLFAVFLTVYLLGQKNSLCAITLYMLIGLVGLPVFSGYSGGPSKLFGPTGGYIVGYVALALIAGYFTDHFPLNQWFFQIFGTTLGLFACYALGTAYFMALTSTPLSEALALCVFPFVFFDLTKMIAAFLVANTLMRSLSYFA